MRIQLWYSEGMKEWRWSLTTRTYGVEGDYTQKTGSKADLREAMGDIANTVEYLVEKTDGKFKG